MSYTDVSEAIHSDPETRVSPTVEFEALAKLNRDLKHSAETMTEQEARYLVDTYYQLQKNRIQTSNRVFAMEAEPHTIIGWLHRNSLTLERNIASALDTYSAAQPIGAWSRSIKGIGPVIAAGLLAHIDMQVARYAGHIYTYAGLNPASEWKKGEKRPWNASLKTLCWKIGESFVKVSGATDALYGQIYKARKELEIERNEAGEFADQAAAVLEKKRIGKTTDAYKAYSEGKLPPAHIHARAKRYAVKFFLSHWFHVAYWHEHGKEPPAPWIIVHDEKHSHFVTPPNFDSATFPVKHCE